MTGLVNKYFVERRHDPAGKHDSCDYFVLDPAHDWHARFALRAYAVSAKRHGNEELYTDIIEWLDLLPLKPASFKPDE